MQLSLRLLAATAAVLVAGAIAAASAAAPGPAGAMRVTLDIRSAGGDGVAAPANFAIRSGGTTTLTVRNHTAVFHTFTVGALGITLLVPPHRSASTTFVAPYGVYHWRCVLCPSGAHPHMHHMGGRMYAIVND